MGLALTPSTQEARVALSYHLVQLLRIFRALQTSRVHPQLDIRTLSMNKFLNLLGKVEPLDLRHISCFIPFQICFVFALLITKYSL